MRRRGPLEGPVRLHQLQPEGARQQSVTHAPQGPSASGLGDRCGRGFRLALLDARSLAGQRPKIEKLGAAYSTTTHDGNVCEHWRVKREYTLTPIPFEILRTVKLAETPAPRRARQTPSNA